MCVCLYFQFLLVYHSVFCFFFPFLFLSLLQFFKSTCLMSVLVRTWTYCMSLYLLLSQVNFPSVGIIKSQSHFLIRLLIVACGRLAHSSSLAVQSRWILAGTGTRCCILVVSRASQTCSIGNMSYETVIKDANDCSKVTRFWWDWNGFASVCIVLLFS